jgi:hypothetical protein
MSAARRRAFGSVRVLGSGRVQARYFGPDGLRRGAPSTFESKAAAKQWLAVCEADMLRGTWSDPQELGEDLGTYAARWISERPGLSERTVRFYEGLLRLHVVPMIRRNPCRIKGAAVEKPKERPLLTLPEVQRLAAAIEPR